MATLITRILQKFRAPALPYAGNDYSTFEEEQFRKILRIYFNQIDATLNTLTDVQGGKYLNFPYGGFQDNTTQTIATTNTAQAVTFNTTDYSNGVEIGTPTSRIVVDNAGLYSFQFSAQLDKASGSSASVWIWPRINGENVPDSASKVSIQGTTAESVPSWNWFLDMEAGDYFELFWLTNDTNVQLKHEAGFGVAPNDVPEIPSVILTVTFVSSLPTG